MNKVRKLSIVCETLLKKKSEDGNSHEDTHTQKAENDNAFYLIQFFFSFR